MGKAFVFGDNVDTDVIVPGRYLNLSEPSELAGVCMAGLEDAFAAKIGRGDIFVAGRNFGCGSSREHAPVSIKAAGVACIIAASFARIFYRNAINIGLPVVQSVEAVGAVNDGDEVNVDLERGIIENLTLGETYRFVPFPPFMLEILKDGGMVGHIRKSSR
ncbi:MAG: 3-isopropylmalate dehydratase small subunit [Firmicutes bacterium]|nr:3-isopropylmalate dehydratase small subunit [Bacillota bacterium]